MGTGNSHMSFYDVTSWSYVNLDDPVRKHKHANFWPRVQRLRPYCASITSGSVPFRSVPERFGFSSIPFLTTSTHHTSTDLFITLPIYWSPASNFKGLTSVKFTINYVPYSLATGLPFGISYVLYVWGHAMSDLPLSSVACDIKHVRIHGKWHSITSNLWFKPCEAWFKHVCSAVGHSSDNGFWHTVLFLKTHSVVLMVAHNTQQLAYHDLDYLA